MLVFSTWNTNIVVEARAVPMLLPLLRHVVPLNEGNYRNKHIYIESANIIEGCNVAFGTNDCWKFQYILPVIAIESMVTPTRPSYTWAFFTPPGICSLINPLLW